MPLLTTSSKGIALAVSLAIASLLSGCVSEKAGTAGQAPSTDPGSMNSGNSTFRGRTAAEVCPVVVSGPCPPTVGGDHPIIEIKHETRDCRVSIGVVWDATEPATEVLHAFLYAEDSASRKIVNITQNSGPSPLAFDFRMPPETRWVVDVQSSQRIDARAGYADIAVPQEFEVKAETFAEQSCAAAPPIPAK